MCESDSSSIMSNNKWNFGFSNKLIDNFAKFESSLLSVDSVRLESTFNIIKNSKMFICLLNGDNIHNAERESGISSNFSIDFDKSFFIFNNFSCFLSIKSILKSLLEKYIKRNALTEFVRTRWGSSTVHSFHFSEEPLLRAVNSLYNLSLSFVALKNDKKDFD